MDCVVLTPEGSWMCLTGDLRPENDVYLGGSLVDGKAEGEEQSQDAQRRNRLQRQWSRTGLVGAAAQAAEEEELPGHLRSEEVQEMVQICGRVMNGLEGSPFPPQTVGPKLTCGGPSEEKWQSPPDDFGARDVFFS